MICQFLNYFLAKGCRLFSIIHKVKLQKSKCKRTWSQKLSCDNSTLLLTLVTACGKLWKVPVFWNECKKVYTRIFSNSNFQRTWITWTRFFATRKIRFSLRYLDKFILEIIISSPFCSMWNSHQNAQLHIIKIFFEKNVYYLFRFINLCTKLQLLLSYHMWFFTYTKKLSSIHSAMADFQTKQYNAANNIFVV